MHKKRWVIICISILLIITIIFIFAYNVMSSNLPSGRLIVMNDNINTDGPFEGLSVIDLKTDRTEIISRTGKFSYMDYCIKRDSVYAVSEDKSGKSEIFEVNLDSKETIPVKLNIKKEETRKYEYLRCIPNRNAISYSDNGHIFIYDFDTQNEGVLISDDGDHSWNKDGTKILYVSSNDMQIHEYNLTTKNDANLKIAGYSPQYSHDEKRVAFFKYEGNTAYPCVMQIANGYKWIYNNDAVWKINFNTDDSSLLMYQTYTNLVSQSKSQLVLWDYEADKIKKLHMLSQTGSEFLFIE